MNTRRDFVKLAGTASLLAMVSARASEPGLAGHAAGSTPGAAATSEEERAAWCRLAIRLAEPMLPALAARRLKAVMPVEAHPKAKDRPEYSHLEALGRLLMGLAPWLELGAAATPEGRVRERLGALARAGIDAATDPASPDYMNFARGGQPLVDAAFLAQALLRAPQALWGRLDERVRRNVVIALRATRVIRPGESNWKLFATMVEVFLHRVGEPRDDVRLFEGLTRHRDWYVGDGVYGDGPEFHWDYYNSFVIQPMFVEALDVVGDEAESWAGLRGKARERLTRWAAIQERLIASDGSYPVLGRSIAYRCGAFQGLALAAWRRMLPPEMKPAQARVALGRVIRRTLEAPGTYDAAGWLQIGLAGHQPGLGETYISTGSLYLCSAAFLPLGLPPADPFWSDPAVPTTWERAWSGENLGVDKALKSPK
ncbi:DUF2264 domain-containing protein [Opitutus sp. ER46]|uniref:DUF2264 domain-containing protein n=1 Tax=Opitutus sp. ER46 TaxID=2161864 RepID=UPI001E4534C8|nr:DUF2264 domain-containing protein [Opitutus sp. ER46]